MGILSASEIKVDEPVLDDNTLTLGQPQIPDYCSAFVQGWPRYRVKLMGGKRWRSVEASSHPLSRGKIQAHLSGDIAVANLGKWYPGHALLDFDGCSPDFVEQVRDALRLSESNSLLCSSESPNSYHLLFRPVYAHHPPTLGLLDNILRPFALYHGIEAYPTATKPCRLPFGPVQQILHPDLWSLKDWRNKLYWFNKLDEYDLGQVPYHQTEMSLEIPAPFLSKGTIPVATEGELLYRVGLQEPHSRNAAQFKVLYFLWRRNVAHATAVAETFRWIRQKHNGYSEDIANPRQVHKEIQRQAAYIYSHYTLPDEAHNHFMGYVTKTDLPDILHLTGGSLPKARFLFHLVRYCYPRRLRPRITVHNTLFKDWASEHTYQQRLKDLSDLGIVERGGYYIVGQKAKDLILHWPYRHPDGAILADGRAPDTLEATLRTCCEPEETRSLVLAAGMDRPQASRFARRVYDLNRPPPLESHLEGENRIR